MEDARHEVEAVVVEGAEAEEKMVVEEMTVAHLEVVEGQSTVHNSVQTDYVKPAHHWLRQHHKMN